MSKVSYKPLDAVAEDVTVGYVGPSAEYFCDDGVPFLRTGNVGERQIIWSNLRRVVPAFHRKQTKSALKKGDIVVSRVISNEVTAAVIPDELDGANCGNVLLIRPGPKLHSEYLAQLIGCPASQRWLIGRQVGSAQAVINTRALAAWEIPILPLEEQRRIAEVLDRAEALRTKRRAALAQLDTLTQSLFLDLFGDDGTNPKKWPVREVADYVREFQGGKSIESESGENVITRNRVLKVSAVTGMKFLAHESKPVPDSYEPPKEHFAKLGDLLFSRANTTELVGAVAYVESTPPNVLLPDKLWRFIWRDPAAIEPLFVWALFQTPTLRREIGRRATGTSGSMKNISQEKVFGIRTIFPPVSLQREFARRVTAVQALKTSQRASLAEMDSLFATLQHRAFQGEL